MQVLSVRMWDQADTRVYNFTVADLHTYHVVAGEPVLVHNCADKAQPDEVRPQRPVASSGKNGPLGKQGEATWKAEKQVKQLREQMKTVPKKEQKLLKVKVRNILRAAAKADKGTEHGRTEKT